MPAAPRSPSRRGDGEDMWRVKLGGELVDRRQRPQLGVTPSTHAPSSCFQIGACALIRSMISRASRECRVSVRSRDGDRDRGFGRAAPRRSGARPRRRTGRGVRSLASTISRHLLSGHLGVCLVAKLGHLASHPEERDHGAGPRDRCTSSTSGSSASGSLVTRTCATPTAPPDTGGISAISSPAPSGLVLGGVFLVDRHHDRNAGGQIAHQLERVVDVRSRREDRATARRSRRARAILRTDGLVPASQARLPSPRRGTAPGTDLHGRGR